MPCQSFPSLAGLTGEQQHFTKFDNMGRGAFRHVIGRYEQFMPRSDRRDVALETQGGQSEIIDEGGDDTDKAIFAASVLQREKRRLIPTYALNETRGAKPLNHAEV